MIAGTCALLSIQTATAGDRLGYGESVDIPQGDPVMDEVGQSSRDGWLEGWEFQLTPYGWASGLDGAIGVGGLSSNVDIDFSDIFENLDASLMLALDGRRDRVGFILEGFWLKLSDSIDTPGPLFSEVDIKVEEILINGAVYYRALEGPLTLDLMAGARYVYIDNELGFDAGLAAARSAQGSEDWVDPIVGIRARFDITDRLYAMLLADVGGFGAGSDLTWQVYLGFGYQLTESLDAKIGWRHMEIDYERGGFLYDVEMDGLAIGLGFTF
mgnify:CR=1 FL=1